MPLLRSISRLEYKVKKMEADLSDVPCKTSSLIQGTGF